MTPQTCPECSKTFSWGNDVDSALCVAGGMPACRANAHWKLHFHFAAEHPDAGFICPRRRESAVRLGGRDWWGRDRGHSSCSYCGSMSPEDLFKEIEAGAEIGPTDKSYKIYVRGSGKFYFQHLSAEQQQTFVDLYNAKKMKIGVPGHFYVLPFFCSRS